MCLLRGRYFESLYKFFGIESTVIPAVVDGNQKFLRIIDAPPGALADLALVYNINLFRIADEPVLSETQLKTVDSIITALKHSPARNIFIVISTSLKDYYFMKDLFKGNTTFIVRLLGHDSRTRLKPYIRDILIHDYYDIAGRSTRASHIYCAYSNADICIPPYFFEFLFQQMSWMTKSKPTDRQEKPAPDCLVINRRDINDDHLHWHPGSDLFVFPAAWTHTMCLGNVCIGLPPIAPIIFINCLYHSRRTIQISDLYTTWHHGTDEAWRSPMFKAETDSNFVEASHAFQGLINYQPSNIDRFDFSKHDILPRKRLKSLIEQWSADLTLPSP